MTAVTAPTAAMTIHVLSGGDFLRGPGLAGWLGCVGWDGLAAGTACATAGGGLSMFRYCSVHPSASMYRSWP